MTALSSSEPRRFESGTDPEFAHYPVAASTTIFAGAFVCISTAAANGFAIPATAGADNVFVGIADEDVDNSAGSAGDKFVRVRKRATIVLAQSGVTGADPEDVGDGVYVSDDGTGISMTQGVNEPQIGILAWCDETQGLCAVACKGAGAN